MTPYFENGLITLYRNRTEHVLPLLNADSFGCVILDPPCSIRTVEDVKWLSDTLGIFRLVRNGGIVYTLATPEQGLFVTVKGPHGEHGSTIFSPLAHSAPSHLHGHYAVRPMGIIKGLLMSTTGRILDPYCGIGTTLLMAQELKRQAVGVEVEKRHCETAAQLLAA